MRPDPDPPASPEAALALAGAATAEEWSELERVAFGLDEAPFERIAAIIDRRAGVPPFRPRAGRASSTSWDECLASASAGDPLRLEAFGRMTLGQWRLLCEPPGRPVRSEPLPDDPDLEDAVMAARARFWGPAHAPVSHRDSPDGPPDSVPPPPVEDGAEHPRGDADDQGVSGPPERLGIAAPAGEGIEDGQPGDDAEDPRRLQELPPLPAQTGASPARRARDAGR